MKDISINGKNKYSHISQCLKKNKEIVDYELVESLYKKCVGS
jgi:hypothetical protein